MYLSIFAIFFKILEIIREVANAELYKCNDDQLNCIIKLANGNVRKAILLLESSSVKYIINNCMFLTYFLVLLVFKKTGLLL